MRFTRIRASRSATIFTLVVTIAMISSMVAGSLQRDDAAAQGVDWLSADSVSYLTSSGIPVMVPSWVPGPVNGSTPEIYAGGGSYSIYFYAGSSFLFISGVAGGGFPGGSEANLNVQLSVNASVQGWPAIQDIGIPAGASTPIYDKVMWIADGVLYTVSGNGLDSDSMTLANSSVALYAPAPAPAQPAPEAPAPEVPAPAAPDTIVEQPVTSAAPTTQQSQPTTGTASETTSSAPAANTATGSSEVTGETGSTETTAPAPTATSSSSDGTSGPWFTGELNADPSDGTDGANPPFLGDDGTGGAP